MEVVHARAFAFRIGRLVDHLAGAVGVEPHGRRTAAVESRYVPAVEFLGDADHFIEFYAHRNPVLTAVDDEEADFRSGLVDAHVSHRVVFVCVETLVFAVDHELIHRGVLCQNRGRDSVDRHVCADAERRTHGEFSGERFGRRAGELYGPFVEGRQIGRFGELRRTTVRDLGYSGFEPAVVDRHGIARLVFRDDVERLFGERIGQRGSVGMRYFLVSCSIEVGFLQRAARTQDRVVDRVVFVFRTADFDFAGEGLFAAAHRTILEESEGIRMVGQRRADALVVDEVGASLLDVQSAGESVMRIEEARIDAGDDILSFGTLPVAVFRKWLADVFAVVAVVVAVGIGYEVVGHRGGYLHGVVRQVEFQYVHFAR